MPVPVIIAGATSLQVIPSEANLTARFFDSPCSPALDAES
jgi:hypothetical protein